ncbi:oxygenase MpaB family protein [soil metagenome]
MADISREGIILAGGGRALLLQLAHPSVGRGVAEHSDFANNPVGRLHGTLSYVYAVAGGTEADVAAMRRTVNKAHAPVRGDGYTAMDPDLQLWVAATLYQSAISIYERVYAPLAPDVAESVYREYAVLGTALQMPESLWPATRADFDSYWSTQLARLEVNDEVREVARTLFRPKRLRLRPLMPIVRFATTALLPENVRAMFELRWSAGKQKRFDRLWNLVTWVYKQYPVQVRSMPRDYYLRQLRGRG